MKIVMGYPDGLFCWVDLNTKDTDKAKAFYQGLFGWEFLDQETDMGTIYTMCQIDGKNVAGLSAMSPEMMEQGAPPVWISYVKHDDVDSVSSKVTEAGGSLMFPPMDVMTAGRMTLAADATGAPFGIWQPKEHTGAQLVNTPNALVWNELQTRDIEGAKKFYGHVFGWESQVDASGYVTFKTNDRIHSGMMKIDESWGPVPPNWSIYFMVEDVDASVAKIKELGGSILVPPTAAGDMGRFSVAQDSQGGSFTVMEFSGPVDDPPSV